MGRVNVEHGPERSLGLFVLPGAVLDAGLDQPVVHVTRLLIQEAVQGLDRFGLAPHPIQDMGLGQADSRLLGIGHLVQDFQSLLEAAQAKLDIHGRQPRRKERGIGGDGAVVGLVGQIGRTEVIVEDAPQVMGRGAVALGRRKLVELGEQRPGIGGIADEPLCKFGGVGGLGVDERHADRGQALRLVPGQPGDQALKHRKIGGPGDQVILEEGHGLRGGQQFGQSHRQGGGAVGAGVKPLELFGQQAFRHAVGRKVLGQSQGLPVILGLLQACDEQVGGVGGVPGDQGRVDTPCGQGIGIDRVVLRGGGVMRGRIVEPAQAAKGIADLLLHTAPLPLQPHHLQLQSGGAAKALFHLQVLAELVDRGGVVAQLKQGLAQVISAQERDRRIDPIL